MNLLISRGMAATFDYGEGGPIFILSGAKNTLFRPALWSVRNARSLLAALEIWTISVGIIWLWLRMTKNEWISNLRNPAVYCAILVLIPFFMIITYFPNEGLIARNRVQVFPALLVLFATPILLRGAQSGKGHSAEREVQGSRRSEVGEELKTEDGGQWREPLRWTS